MDIHELSVEVSEMIHLRYLGLSGNNLRWVPSTISNLVNLQTLDIKTSDSTYGVLLPSTIKRMDQLRHIHINGGRITKGFRIDCLTNLQTLSTIEAGGWIKDGLARLRSLRKRGIELILNSHKEALSKSILKLDRLQSLYLKGSDVPTSTLSNHVHLYRLELVGPLEKLPELHEFPPNLTHLSLNGSFLMHDPMVILEKLPHLKILNLWHETFMGNGMVCSAEGFPQLKELGLWGFNNLEEWKLEEGALSSLRHLIITYCSKLKMLPEGLQHVTTLQELMLDVLSKELKDRILGENGEDWHKIRHVPSLIINGEKIDTRSI